MVLKRHNNDGGIYKICFAGTTCGWTVASFLDFFRVNYFIDFWARNDENTEAFELQSAV